MIQRFLNLLSPLQHKICHRDLKLENILLDESKSAKVSWVNLQRD